MGFNPNLAALGAQEQEALLGRAAALRELGIGGAPGGAQGMDRLQQLELGRLEELERRRQQLAALANLGGAPPRPGEIPSAGDALAESTKSNEEKEKAAAATAAATAAAASSASAISAEKSKDDLRKTPGTVIVPCRARGMPMDHNFKVSKVGC